MPRPFAPYAPLALVSLAALALACRAEPETERSTPAVVVRTASGSTTHVPAADAGLEVGPRGSAPEVVVLAEREPAEPATPRPVRRPEPGPKVIYRTIYVDAPAADEAAPEAEPVPAVASAPILVPEDEPVEPDPAPAEAPAPTASPPAPVATAPPSPTPTTFPDGGSSRVEDAAIGAAIGAGIGAILDGRRGAIAGGIGGAVGGAIGGRSGGILGGVLGGGRGAGWPEPRCRLTRRDLGRSMILDLASR